MTLISWRDWGRRLWLSVLPIVFAWSGASAQGLTTGALRGTVRDAAGTPLGDVLVTLTAAGTGMSRLRTSDVNGGFSFGQLAPGDYELLVESGGFIPVRVTDVPVRPGRSATADVTIRGASGEVSAPDVVRYQGASSGTQPQFLQWFSRSQLTQTPFHARELTEALRLSSNSSQLVPAVDGLPARMLGYSIDGVVHRGATSGVINAFPLTSLPLAAFEAGELITNGIDVERNGFAGPVLNGYSRRGAPTWQPAVFGRMAAVASGDGFEDLDRPSDFQLAGVFSGPLSKDSASFLIGADVRRYDAPFAAPWAFADDNADAVVAAADAQDIGLAAFARAGLARTEAVSAFARGEWQVSGKHRLETRLNFGSAPTVAFPVSFIQSVPFGAQSEVTTLSASGALLSELSASASNEVRFAVTSDQQDYTPFSADAFVGDRTVPFTTIVRNGLMFGGSAASTAEFGRRQVTASNALTIQASRHAIKLGASIEAGFLEQTRFFGAAPQAVFGSAEDLTAQRGFLVQPIGVPATAEFTLSQFGAFLQDTWRAANGLEVIAGLRYERETLPVNDLQVDVEWLRLTGLSNVSAPATISKVSPRFAIKWEPGDQGWVFGAGAGVYYSESDVNALAAATAASGRTRRRFGSIAAWSAPLPTDTIGSGRSLTLLSSGFTAPKSLRASAGVSKSLPSQISLHLAANYRETTGLSRYVDLNRWADPLFEDQNGRPVYGQLVQQGELIAVNPGSNRRFAGYDQVLGVKTDGRSEHTAVTVAMDRATAQGVNVMASYTYSKTTDNWFGASLNDPQIASGIVSSQGAEWEDGRSDFDIPHRFVLAADVAAPAGIRIGALFRYESGIPFTPGSPAGVDLNGDGFAGNDPAFIDASVSDVLQQSDCDVQAGSFAERNSCRTDAVRSLDLRISADVLRGRGGTLQVMLDATNVLQSEVGLPDRALYQINGGGQLTTDANGRVTVPLIPNPQFGELQQRASLPRMLRIGLQFNW